MDLEREVGWVERETACRGQREDEPMEFGLGRVEREREIEGICWERNLGFSVCLV